MNTNIVNELMLAKDKVRYDEYAKRILSNVWLLAWILKNTTAEFAHVPIGQIVKEGIGKDIFISKVAVNPGEADCSEEDIPERIIGDNTEDKVPNEGRVNYDVRFSAYVPGSGEPVKILVNVEAQGEFRPGYPIVTRGVFYTARMVSAQLDTEFKADDYSKLKKVYSIWVCMNVPDYIGNTISEYSMKKSDILGYMPDIRGDYDKMSVVMICLNEKLQDMNEKNLTKLLNTVFSETMSIEEKKEILSAEYGIPVDRKTEGGFNDMCNLGEAIWQRGIRQGMQQGKQLTVVKLVRSKLARGFEIMVIADLLEESIDVIRRIADIIKINPKLTDEEIVRNYL